mmetsp:Transcript_27933/g.80401  ORF Transcript_27933/g.80401 Transcript_27933/m.80401 type:complete len:143 (-) Transcript_27933:826-1254(-)
MAGRVWAASGEKGKGAADRQAGGQTEGHTHRQSGRLGVCVLTYLLDEEAVSPATLGACRRISDGRWWLIGFLRPVRRADDEDTDDFRADTSTHTHRERERDTCILINWSCGYNKAHRIGVSMSVLLLKGSRERKRESCVCVV